jgi:hypothetical protein
MVRQVHPIERLRFVARAGGVDHGVLVRETAAALGALGFDPAGLVTACRRIVDRHPTAGPLWWLCSRVLTSSDPLDEAWRCADEIDEDPTASRLAAALPDDATVCVIGWPELTADALVRRGDLRVLAVDVEGGGHGFARRLRRSDVEAEEVDASGLGPAAAAADLVVLEPSAVGPDGFVGPIGSRAAAAVASCAGRQVWLVTGVGRLLPGPTWEALASRLTDDEPWTLGDEVVPLGLVGELAGPDGPEPIARGLTRTSCPIAPELYRPTAF